jgi:hypothetical protein
MILLHRHSGEFFFSFANLKFLKVLKNRIHAKIGNSSPVCKNTLSAKIRKLAKTDSSEGLFFLFFLSPLTDLEATTRHEKKQALLMHARIS